MSEPLSKPGLAYGAGAYLVWGTFPLLMHALEPAGALEITAHRAVWSVVVCGIIVAVVGAWRRVWAALRDRRTLISLLLASFFIAANWLIYVFAVITDHVNSAALGYYINPLFTVALGVIFLGERLRRMQVVAIGIVVVAVLIIGVGLGEFPWIALALATSFGLYGLIKKQVGSSVDTVTGLTVETLLLTPFALLALWWIAGTDRQTFAMRGDGGLGISHDLLMASTGVVTAGALLLFAAGARRLPLYVTGLLQYIAPTGMFILAVWHFGEPMPTSRWVGFVLVWIALIVLTLDGWRRRPRRGIAEVEPAEPV